MGETDLISRQEAIDAVEHITSSMSVCVNTDECHGMKRMQRQAVIELTNMPAEQKTQLSTEDTTFDCISRREAIDGLDGHRVERRNLNDWQEGWNAALDWVQGCYLEDLPSAQPEQKTGKWIKHSIGHEHTPWGFDCSECGEWLVVGEEIVKKYNYCPNCGADMRGEQE